MVAKEVKTIAEWTREQGIVGITKFWRCSQCTTHTIGADSVAVAPCENCGGALQEVSGDDPVEGSRALTAGQLFVGAAETAELLLDAARENSIGPLDALIALEMARREMLSRVKRDYSTEAAARITSQLDGAFKRMDRMEEENEALGPFFGLSDRGSA